MFQLKYFHQDMDIGLTFEEIKDEGNAPLSLALKMIEWDCKYKNCFHYGIFSFRRNTGQVPPMRLASCQESRKNDGESDGFY